MPAPDDLPPFDAESGALNVVIETPKGSGCKFKYQPETGLFTIGHVLPAGAVFPFDFGFVPGTKAGDGDPLDVLVLLDAPAFPGCLVPCRLVGVIEARQTEGGELVENDRLIGVATATRLFKGVKALDDIPPGVWADVEHFFIAYDQARGKEFKPTGRGGPGRAAELVRAAVKAAGGG